MEWDKEMVHNQAFKVCKTDLKSVLENNADITLTKALGFEASFEDVIGKRMPIIFDALQKKTKTESIAYLLENSDSLQEYTLLLIGFGINL